MYANSKIQDLDYIKYGGLSIHATICANCGYPDGYHYGTNCPGTEEFPLLPYKGYLPRKFNFKKLELKFV